MIGINLGRTVIAQKEKETFGDNFSSVLCRYAANMWDVGVAMIPLSIYVIHIVFDKINLNKYFFVNLIDMYVDKKNY
jgi:hypothetical protein